MTRLSTSHDITHDWIFHEISLTARCMSYLFSTVSIYVGCFQYHSGMCTANERSLALIIQFVYNISKQHTLRLLRECALKHPKLVSIKPQLASILALHAGPLRVQEHLQRVVLRRINVPPCTATAIWRASHRDPHRTHLARTASAPSAPARARVLARARARRAASWALCPRLKYLRWGKAGAY